MAVLSGQKSVTTAGTAVQAGTDETVRNYMLRAEPSNTGDIFIGNDGDGDVTAANGLALAKTDPPIPFRGRLSDLWVDADNNGDTLCWMRVNAQ